MKIKVCGMRNTDNINEVAKLMPEFMGFIFYEKSPRFVGDDFNTLIISKLPIEINKVGVFVNAELNFVLQTVEKYDLNYIQLHGDESAEYCEYLGHYVKVIKSFGVSEEFDFSTTKEFEKHCTYFLFDTRYLNYGGSGKVYNWNLLNMYNGVTPFILSGGLNEKNIDLAFNGIHDRQIGIDLNSGFELEPGLKNYKLIKESLYDTSI